MKISGWMDTTRLATLTRTSQMTQEINSFNLWKDGHRFNTQRSNFSLRLPELANKDSNCKISYFRFLINHTKRQKLFVKTGNTSVKQFIEYVSFSTYKIINLEFPTPVNMTYMCQVTSLSLSLSLTHTHTRHPLGSLSLSLSRFHLNVGFTKLHWFKFNVIPT